MKRTVLTALVAGLCLAVIQPSIWAAALTPAEQAAQNAAAFAEAQALAKGAVNGAASGINDNSIANTINGFSNPNYQYSDTAPEAALFQGGNGNTQAAGVSKINDCQNGPVDPDAFKQQNCDAINYMAKQPATRPQFDVSNDPNIARSRAITANASSLAANSLGFVDPNAVGAFSGCTTKTTTMAASTITEVCHDFTSSVSQSCALGRSVVVDANTNYQCDKTTKGYENLKCNRISSVTCTGGGDGCDRGGIVPNSWAGDMATTFKPDGAGNYILQFGTIADNYWGGWGTVYDRTMTFTVKDVALVSLFSLVRAAFDDWLLVSINGTVVYVGPKGGDRLETFHKKCTGTRRACDGFDPGPFVRYCATCEGSPELSTNWIIGLSINLKPYLKTGANTIFVRTIVAGYGEGAIQIRTRQVCPITCTASTNNQCQSLEARAL